MPSCTALYTRKSTDTEDKQILSIPSQLAELGRFAESRGLRVDTKLTEACSAREPGRPVFGRLLADVQAGRVDRIVCWKLDRLARNPVDGGTLIHLLGKGLLKEIVTPEGTYTGSGDSKFMLSVLFGAATKMTDDLAAGVKRGNRALYERGRISAAPPIGYLKVRDRAGFRGAGTVVPDPERFHLVERIWKRVLTGGTSVAEAWRLAVAEGLTTRGNRRTPGGPIKVTYVYAMLRNPLYAGLIVRDGTTYHAEHQAMVTPAEFERVQQLVARGDAPRPSTNLDFLFRGKLSCGDCGRLLVAERVRKRSGRSYDYYRCGRRRPGYRVCRAPAPSEAEVIAAFTRNMAKVSLSPRVATWANEAIDILAERDESSLAGAKRAAETELRSVETQLERLTDLVIQGHIDTAEFERRKARLTARRLELNDELADPAKSVETWRRKLHEGIRLLTSLSTAFESASFERQRELLTELYANSEVKDRIPAPALRFPFTELGAAPSEDALPEDGDANPRKILETALNQTQNAPLPGVGFDAFLRWCAGEDSNLHALASASPSSWCVYQFRHLRLFFLFSSWRLGKPRCRPQCSRRRSF